MKKKIKSLEDEKERLNDKVGKAKAQVDKIADRQPYMDACSALRKQQDEEVSLSLQLQVRCGAAYGIYSMEELVSTCKLTVNRYRTRTRS